MLAATMSATVALGNALGGHPVSSSSAYRGRDFWGAGRVVSFSQYPAHHQSTTSPHVAHRPALIGSRIHVLKFLTHSKPRRDWDHVIRGPDCGRPAMAWLCGLACPGWRRRTTTQQGRAGGRPTRLPSAAVCPMLRTGCRRRRWRARWLDVPRRRRVERVRRQVHRRAL